MAADNYSDVVQALAQQIVEACMQTLRKNMQGLISSAVISADQIEGDVSNVNTSNLVMNVDNITGLNDFVAGAIKGSRIDISQIATLGADGKLYLNDVNIHTGQVEDLEVRFADIWRADIRDANIQRAIIDALHANFAQIADAQIDKATIHSAQIDDLEAAAADIAKAEIGTAEIDWAQIKSLTADDVIIQKGLGGKLYIADLAVTEANMVSLTVGELMVKGADGGFYAVSVDEQGKITATKKTVSTGDIDDLSITGDKIADGTISGDTKIIESSITARTLNVQDIFAENATVLSLIAKNLNVDELFARTAFINKLNTTDISGNQSLQLAVQTAYEDAMREVSIRLSEDAIVATVTGSQAFSDYVDEKTKETVTVVYAIGDNGTEPPPDDTDWRDEIPLTAEGDYLWTKTTTVYANGSEPSVVYTVTKFGTSGVDGIVLRIQSDSGTIDKTGSGTITLTADVYAGGNRLNQTKVNALGKICWYVDGQRIPAAQNKNWHELDITLPVANNKSVYSAALMG